MNNGDRQCQDLIGVLLTIVTRMGMWTWEECLACGSTVPPDAPCHVCKRIRAEIDTLRRNRERAAAA